MANAPTATYRFGPVSLSVWENTGKSKDGKEFTTKSFQLAKNYKDKDNNWKTTNNYKVGELINVIQVAQAALENYYNRVKPSNASLPETTTTKNTDDIPFWGVNYECVSWIFNRWVDGN